MNIVFRALLTLCLGIPYASFAEGAAALVYPRLGDIVKIGESNAVVVIESNTSLSIPAFNRQAQRSSR